MSCDSRRSHRLGERASARQPTFVPRCLLLSVAKRAYSQKRFYTCKREPEGLRHARVGDLPFDDVEAAL